MFGLGRKVAPPIMNQETWASRVRYNKEHDIETWLEEFVQSDHLRLETDLHGP